MNVVKSFVSAEGTWAEWDRGVVAVGIGAGVAVGGIWNGAGGVVGRIWKGARIWISVVVVGGLRVSVVYSFHIHVHEAGRVIEIDRVCFVSCCDVLHKLGVEVEG